MVSNMYGIHIMYWRCLCDASATQYAIFAWKIITIEKYFQCVFWNSSNLPGFFGKSRVLSKNGVIIWDYRMFGTISSSVILSYPSSLVSSIHSHVHIRHGSWKQLPPICFKETELGLFQRPTNYLSLKYVSLCAMFFCCLGNPMLACQCVPFLLCTGVEGTHGILSAPNGGCVMAETNGMNSIQVRMFFFWFFAQQKKVTKGCFGVWLNEPG